MNTQEHVHIWLMFFVFLPQLIQLAQACAHDAMHLPSCIIWLIVGWTFQWLIHEVGFDDDMASNELMLELIGLECSLSQV